MKNVEVKGDFCIIPSVYEAGLDKKYGIKLSSLEYGDDVEMDGDLEKKVLFRDGVEYSLEEIDKNILKKHEKIPGYSSMKLKNMDELFVHIENLHKISYNSYAYGRSYAVGPLKHDFPDSSCDRADRNEGLNSLAAGYHNATMINNQLHNHCYSVFPFILKDEGLEGFVLVDPSSDQRPLVPNIIDGHEIIPPRNHVMVSFGKKWTYERKENIDLFPSEKSGYTNLDVLRNYPSESLNLSTEWDKYFDNVFKNPIKIETQKAV